VKQNKIIELILMERKYQDIVWGTSGHTDGEWLLILMAEIGDVTKSSLLRDRVFIRLIRVAAVVVAWLEDRAPGS